MSVAGNITGATYVSRTALAKLAGVAPRRVNDEAAAVKSVAWTPMPGRQEALPPATASTVLARLLPAESGNLTQRRQAAAALLATHLDRPVTMAEAGKRLRTDDAGVRTRLQARNVHPVFAKVDGRFQQVVPQGVLGGAGAGNGVRELLTSRTAKVSATIAATLGVAALAWQVNSNSMRTGSTSTPGGTPAPVKPKVVGKDAGPNPPSLDEARSAAEGADAKSEDGARASIVLAAVEAAEAGSSTLTTSSAFIRELVAPLRALGNADGDADPRALLKWAVGASTYVEKDVRPAKLGDIAVLDASGDDLLEDTYGVVVDIDGETLTVATTVEGGPGTTVEYRSYAVDDARLSGYIDPTIEPTAENLTDLGLVAPPVAAAPTLPAPAPAAPTYAMGNLTPNQYETWPRPIGPTACGLAASIAFARFLGQNPDGNDVLAIGRKHGYTPAAGMSTGSNGVVATLAEMGIAVDRQRSVDVQRIRDTVSAGKPVIVGTEGHYWVAEGYDPATDRFNFGTSAAILSRSGGNTWYRIDEMASLKVGQPATTIYLA